MIFQSNDRKFQFFLLELNDVEHVEMTNLITKNGGEVSAQEKPPAIRFANCENYDGKDPVFHINYIRECVKHQQLLDLINFKIGPQGYYGCLMSIFVYGENMCSFIEDTVSCCSSTQIRPSSKYCHTITADHIYAQGDFTMVQVTSNAKPWSALGMSSQEPQFMPTGSLSDSESLPGKSLQSSSFLPGEAPRDSECMPAGSSPDVEFVPDNTSQNSELIPVTSPRDSEFLLHEPPQHSGFIPDGPSSNSEFSPAPIPPDLEFPPGELPENPRFTPDTVPKNSEFLPHGSPQNPVVPTGCSQYSEILPEESRQYQECPPAVSPGDLESFPEESQSTTKMIVIERAQDRLSGAGEIEFALELPEPARFEELDYNLDSLRADQSLSEDITLCQNSHPVFCDNMTIIHIPLKEANDVELNANVALPCLNVNEVYPLGAAEEEMEVCENVPVSVETDDTISLNARLERFHTTKLKTLNRDTSPRFKSRELMKKSPTKNIVDEQPVAGGSKTVTSPIILRDESRVESDHVISLNARLERLRTTELKTLDRDTSRRFKSRELERKSPAKNIVDKQLVAGGSKTAASPPILRNESRVESNDRTSSSVRLERLQTTQLKTLDRATSPKFKSTKLKKKSPAKNMLVDEEPIAGMSKTSASPTILRDKFNRIKILGGYEKSFDTVKQFRLSSSDTDDMDCYPIVVISDCEQRRSVNQSSSSKIQEADAKKKVLRKRRVIRSPSRDSNMSDEDREVTKILNNNKRTIQRSRSESNSDSSTTSDITSRVRNKDKNTVVSSTRSSADVILISNSDSDLSSEDEKANSVSSCRVANPAACPTKTKPKAHKVMRNRPLTRNYLPWEQREMVKYLINKHLISEAKGNRVWKRMIEDGYLTHRTFFSLNNHFRKYILPKIHLYPMNREHLQKFQQLLE